jgi:hypothetical protein
MGGIGEADAETIRILGNFVAVQFGEASLGAIPAYEAVDLGLGVFAVIGRQAGEEDFRCFPESGCVV